MAAFDICQATVTNVCKRYAESRRLETERNQQPRGICWQFTARDARVKLEKLYPIKQPASN